MWLFFSPYSCQRVSLLTATITLSPTTWTRFPSTSTKNCSTSLWYVQMQIQTLALYMCSARFMPAQSQKPCLLSSLWQNWYELQLQQTQQWLEKRPEFSLHAPGFKGTHWCKGIYNINVWHCTSLVTQPPIRPFRVRIGGWVTRLGIVHVPQTLQCSMCLVII